MIVTVPWLPWGASGLTLWPFILVHRDVCAFPTLFDSIVTHERVHLRQISWWAGCFAVANVLAWCVITWSAWPAMVIAVPYGLVAGAVCGNLAWRACYLLALPIGWNWFRWHAEWAAYKAQNVADWRIRETLRRPPYFLFWMR